MNEELNKRLAELASKLNVSVEHLWGVLVRQAYIDGISSLCTMLVCMVLGVAAVYAFFHLRRKFKTPDTERLTFYPPPPMDLMLLGMVLLLLVVIALSNFYWVVSDFLNPEFYALQHLPFAR
jgi:hypothetical protein